jgi:hypothetical protein
MNKINYIVLVGATTGRPTWSWTGNPNSKTGEQWTGGVGARLRRGVLGKHVREVIGVNMHCFEVTGGEGLTAVATPRRWRSSGEGHQ